MFVFLLLDNLKEYAAPLKWLAVFCLTLFVLLQPLLANPVKTHIGRRSGLLFFLRLDSLRRAITHILPDGRRVQRGTTQQLS